MKLANQVEIPALGLGVYKMAAGAEMNAAVGAAYAAGYRLFDTAQMYGNEAALGQALQANGIPRKEVFLISKVDNGNQWYQPTLDSFEQSLERLQTDYLDAFLVHWPGQDQARTLSTWQAMEKLYADGKVRSIGVCNFEQPQLEHLLSHCQIAPMLDQIEHTPLQHNRALLDYCSEKNIKVMAWAPLLRGDFDHPVIQNLARKYGKTPAQILLRWNVQQGIIPIPKSKNPARLAENIAVFDFALEGEDMAALNSMDQNRRTSHDPLTFDF